MVEIMKFPAWLQALGLNLIMDESEHQAQSFKVEAKAFRAFEQLVQLWDCWWFVDLYNVLQWTVLEEGCLFPRLCISPEVM